MEVEKTKEIKDTKLCKHCQSEIHKKAKVCPNCRKKQSGIKKWILIILVVLVFFGIVGNEDDETSQNVSTTQNDNIEQGNENTLFSKEDFETTEYIYENTIGDTLYYVTVENNSEVTVVISGNATAYDGDNNAIGADSSEMIALGAGQEQIMYFYFDGVTNVKKVEYTLDYSEEKYYESAFQDLTIEETANKDNVIVTITNNGDEPVQFIEAYALFLDSQGNVVDYESTYIVDSDSEIKPQKTISEQLSSYKNFSDVKVYYTGRKK